LTLIDTGRRSPHLDGDRSQSDDGAPCDLSTAASIRRGGVCCWHAADFQCSHCEVRFRLKADMPSYHVVCPLMTLSGHIVSSYSDLREAISMEKRYFTSDLSSLS
jgi:hypothetical protein